MVWLTGCSWFCSGNTVWRWRLCPTEGLVMCSANFLVWCCIFPDPKSLFLVFFLDGNVLELIQWGFLGFQALILVYAEYCVWRIREFLFLFSELEICWAKFLFWDRGGTFWPKITYSAYFRLVLLFLIDLIWQCFGYSWPYWFTDIDFRRSFVPSKIIQPGSTELSKIIHATE